MRIREAEGGGRATCGEYWEARSREGRKERWMVVSPRLCDSMAPQIPAESTTQLLGAGGSLFSYSRGEAGYFIWSNSVGS